MYEAENKNFPLYLYRIIVFCNFAYMKTLLRRFHLSHKKSEKISDIIFDVVKYMITVELIAFLFSDIQNWHWYNFAFTLLILLGLVYLGDGFLDDDDNNNKNEWAMTNANIFMLCVLLMFWGIYGISKYQDYQDKKKMKKQ